MNIVYIGTPGYSCVPLNALIAAGHNVSLVLTGGDKPRGRGNVMTECPVKMRAKELGIPVISPLKIKNNPETAEAIRNAQPDFLVSFSYGHIIPQEILDIPKIAALNLHASLLPKYRGAAPIQRAVLNGESKTGICIMQMQAGLDTGGVYACAETDIGRKTSAQLFNELAETGAGLLVKVLPDIASGKLIAAAQDDAAHTYADLIDKSEARISWEKDAAYIDRMVRAFNDSPVAFTFLDGNMLKIYEAEPASGTGHPGEIIYAGKNGIEVACGEGSLVIKKLQAPGKKVMDSYSFLLGKKLETGKILG